MTREEKITRIFLYFAFCSSLGLCSYACDDPYVAGLTSFLCFAFCFALMLMLSCEQGFSFQCLLAFSLNAYDQLDHNRSHFSQDGVTESALDKLTTNKDAVFMFV